MSNTFDKVSFWAIFCVVVLFPIFLFPFTNIPFETAKGFLLAFGMAVSIIFWAIARFTEGKIALPRSFVLVTGLLFTIGVLLSAYYSSPRSLSFFGAMFDFGSASYLTVTFLLMTMCAILVRTLKNAKIILLGFIFSSTVLFVFQTLHIFFPNVLSLGVMTGKTDSLMGSWNALGLFASFFSILGLYILEFFKIPKVAKYVLCLFMVFSLFVLIAVNFYIAWALFEVFALIIFIYKISFSYHLDHTQEVKKYFPTASFAFFMLAFLFFILSQSLGAYVPKKLQLQNTDATPTFKSDYVVGRGVLANSPVFGVGPNKFGEAWAMHRLSSTNQGPFWNNYFEFGKGVVSTIMATTGYVGISTLLLFLLVLFASGMKSLFNSIKDGANWDVVIFFLGSVFLFSATVFYSTGPVIFVLAMAFAGIFVGVSLNKEKDITIVFSKSPKKSFFFLFLLMGIIVATVFFGFKYLERFASVPYVRNSMINMSDPLISIPAVDKAVSLNPNDLYYRAQAQTYAGHFTLLATRETPLTPEETTLMEGYLDKAVKSAIAATEFNENSYLNFQLLGSVYLNAGQLGVQDAFPQAIDAYTKASLLNPSSPGLKLSIARAHFFNGSVVDAGNYTEQALDLKPDYIDALIVMSQVKNNQKSTTEALAYAEQALALTEGVLFSFPTDQTSINRKKDLVEYIDNLKKPVAPTNTETKNKKP